MPRRRGDAFHGPLFAGAGEVSERCIGWVRAAPGECAVGIIPTDLNRAGRPPVRPIQVVGQMPVAAEQRRKEQIIVNDWSCIFCDRVSRCTAQW